MPDLDFQDFRSGLRARDLSPDSVIFAAESISASSPPLRPELNASLSPQMFLINTLFLLFFLRHELSEALSGPDPYPDKSITLHRNSISLSRKDKSKVQKLDSSESETTEDENVAIDSARNALKCQDRRLRSELLLKKADRRRPASLDLNNPLVNAVTSTSPRLGVMKKPSATATRIGTFPSPGTPNYRHTSLGIHKGWSSERIPPLTNTNRRNVSTALLPFNNGRTLPSKWEDAERWIVSPVSGDGAMRTLQQQAQRWPKSKSGPLGHPGAAYYQMFSPVTPMFEGSRAVKLTANTPFSAGVVVAAGEGTWNFLNGTEPCMARSISMHGCSEMISQSSLPGSQDVKYDMTEDAANCISRAVSRRDMATQMSPESSKHSSRGRDSSFSLATPSILPIVESQSMRSSKPEMRDVVVDEHVTMIRWSKRNRVKNPGRGSRNADHSASWDVLTETSKSSSKIQREEAKITAWENLQKAKAEAAIRKLEMKLEKKRSSSMDKIMKKLRSVQKKAQEMRGSVMVSQTTSQMGRPERALSFQRTRPISSLSGCFTCHAF